MSKESTAVVAAAAAKTPTSRRRAEACAATNQGAERPEQPLVRAAVGEDQDRREKRDDRAEPVHFSAGMAPGHGADGDHERRGRDGDDPLGDAARAYDGHGEHRQQEQDREGFEHVRRDGWCR